MLLFDKIFLLRYNNIEFHIYLNIEMRKTIASVHFYLSGTAIPTMSTYYNMRLHKIEKFTLPIMSTYHLHEI